MAANVLVDTGFLLAFLRRRDAHNTWAVTAAQANPPPWRTCEAVLSEAYFVLVDQAGGALADAIRRKLVIAEFSFDQQVDAVLELRERYSNVPMSFADACLVRMSELASDPLVLTTDSDFSVYRRHGRKIIPCMMPG